MKYRDFRREEDSSLHELYGEVNKENLNGPNSQKHYSYFANVFPSITRIIVRTMIRLVVKRTIFHSPIRYHKMDHFGRAKENRQLCVRVTGRNRWSRIRIKDQ